MMKEVYMMKPVNIIDKWIPARVYPIIFASLHPKYFTKFLDLSFKFRYTTHISGDLHETRES